MGSPSSSDTNTYSVVLVPRDVALEEASDNRTVTVELPTTLPDRKSLFDAVGEHLATEGPIDPWAFRKHWDVSHVIRTDGKEYERLRDTLLGFEFGDAAEEQALTTQAIYLKDMDGSWAQATLAVRPRVAKTFRQRVATICGSDDFEDVQNRHVHDAMTQVVAARHPSLSNQLLADPLTKQSTFVELTMASDDEVRHVLSASKR